MLRQLSRVLWFGAHSLRHCTYSRPEEVEWLRRKFYGNTVWASKLEYLSKLEREKGLRNFFDDKSIDLLSEEEIYFLFNSTIDYRLGQRARQEIMAKISSSYFLCLLAKEFRWVDQVEQSLIILRFNQELADLQLREIAFCLEIISEFPAQELKVEQEALQRRLLYFLAGEEHTYHFILIAGYLLEMGMQSPEIVNRRNFQHWFATNDNFDFRAIYFIYKLSEKLDSPLQEAQLNTLKTHMKDAILNLHLNYFEQNYVVFLLQYYPQYLKILNILHFTPRAYIGYLLFFKQNPHVKVTEHKIPQSVVELTDFVSFRTIIDLRMHLALDNPLSLAKALPHYFAYSLKAVNSFLAYLRDNRIDDVEVHFLIQKAVTQKLRLGQEFSLEIAENFSVDEILNMLAQLVRNRQCSVDFWKKAVKMLQRMVEISLHSKIIESSNDNYTNLLSIASSKNFTQETRQKIYQELIRLLSRPSNEWTMKQFVKLTKILAANRIGEDQIVLLIERRVLRILQGLRDPRAVMGETLKDNLVKLIMSLNSLEKGSYKFWSQVNQLLDGKTKKDILNRIKNPKSIAHTYLASTQ